MLSDERKLEKFRKATAWTMFICAMAALLSIAVMYWAGENSSASAIALIFLVMFSVLVGVGILTCFIVQLLLEIRGNGRQVALQDFGKELGVSIVVGVVIVLLLGEVNEIGFGLIKQILPYTGILFICGYLGKFWKKKNNKK